MKILHLSTGDVVGGACIAAFRLHLGLKRIGVNSTMLVWRKDSDDSDVFEVPKGFRYLLSKVGSRMEDVCLRLCCDRGQAWDGGLVPGFAARLIREMQPDIVNLHFVNRGLISVGQVARLGLPVVWTFHDMWPITSGYHYYGSKLTPELAPPDGGFDPDISSNILTRALLAKKCRAWKDVNLDVVCPSQWLQGASKKSPTVAGKKIHHIPYGLDLEIYRPMNKEDVRKSLGLPVDKKLILFGAASSDNDPRKGSDLLLGAMHYGIKESLFSAEETELVTFGQQAKLPGALQKMKVHSMGRVSGDELLARIYASADVFIAPSREDNLPNTVLEAMACGVPTVAFRIGGMPDMIDHEMTGYLAEPFDIESLARGVAHALQHVDPGVVRKRAELCYPIEKQAANYFALYKTMLSSGGNDPASEV